MATLAAIRRQVRVALSPQPATATGWCSWTASWSRSFAGVRCRAGPDRLPARPCRSTACPSPICPRHGPQSLADGFLLPSRRRNDRPDPRLSLALGMIRGRDRLPSGRRASSRASEPAPRLSTPGSTANSTPSPRSPARPRPGVASFREGRPPACPRPRSGAKLLPGLAPTPPAAADRGTGSGIAACLAISRGLPRGF
jgi:hypothetical protein